MFAVSRKELDIADSEALRVFFERVSPDFVINCAAFTDVDGCESNREEAFKVNSTAAKEIAKACKRENAVFLHFSTDYVFDGKNAVGYAEDDSPNPINVYGESKLGGEIGIMDSLEEFYIVRTAWLYGMNGGNFVDTMLKLAGERESLNVVDDQKGSPTYADDLVKAVIEYFLEPFVVNLPVQHAREVGEPKSSRNSLGFGVYHLTNLGVCSWHGFAKEIFRIKDLNVEVKPVSSVEFVRAAERPHCSILLNTKLPNLRSWEEALNAYLK